MAAKEHYQRAAEAYRRAGDIDRSNVTLQEALSILGGVTAANPPDANATSPNAASPGGQDATAGDKTIPTPCQDLTGKFGCQDGKRPPLEREARLNQGDTERINRPRPWSPEEITPDYTAAIMNLAKAMVDADVATNRDAKIREQLHQQIRNSMQRRMADHRAPLKKAERDCLQPVVVEGPRLLDYPLRWHPYHIKKEAIDQSGLCDGVPEGEAKDICREAKYGQAVMWAEPELAGQCRGAGDLDDVAECARRKFLNAWAKNDGVVQAPAPDRWIMPGSCNPNGTPSQREDTLRDMLRARLASVRDNKEAARPDGEPAAKSDGTAPAADDPSTPPAPPLTDANEAYCSAMARAMIRGELTPGGSALIPPECKTAIAAAEALKAKQTADGHPPFTWSDVDADAEIARMVQSINPPSGAKTAR